MTIKQVLTKHEHYDMAGYLYRYGLVIVYKDNKGVVKHYFKAHELECNHDNFTRVVIHDMNTLYFGLPIKVKIHEHQNEYSEQLQKLNIDSRIIQFYYPNNGVINFTQYSFDSPYYVNSSICVQGHSYFDSFNNNRLDTITGLSESVEYAGYIELK